jgi:hypothetical protein
MKTANSAIQKSLERVYFAHSMLSYNTEKERRELGFIKARFPNTICPNRDIGRAQRGMPAYLNIVAWADRVVVTDYEGYVGRGVHDEVKHALHLGIPVIYLHDSMFIQVKDVRINDPRDYRYGYAELVLGDEA